MLYSLGTTEVDQQQKRWRGHDAESKEDAQEKVKARDLLERRLLLVFNVGAVETRCWPSRSAWNRRRSTSSRARASGLLVWAADKEVMWTTPRGPALQASRRRRRRAARQLLPKNDPLAPKLHGRLGPRPLRAVGALRERRDAGVPQTAAVSCKCRRLARRRAEQRGR